MPEVFKRKEFAKWQEREGLADTALCRAVQEMRSGLVDADLGCLLFKKRVARTGHGKRGGYRTVLSASAGMRYVFLHGFAKSDKDNITPAEKKALQFAGTVFLKLSGEALRAALASGVLMEVGCEQDH